MKFRFKIWLVASKISTTLYKTLLIAVLINSILHKNQENRTDPSARYQLSSPTDHETSTIIIVTTNNGWLENLDQIQILLDHTSINWKITLQFIGEDQLVGHAGIKLWRLSVGRQQIILIEEKRSIRIIRPEGFPKDKIIGSGYYKNYCYLKSTNLKISGVNYGNKSIRTNVITT